VWQRPEHIEGTAHLHDAEYEPLWSYLAEANVPMAIHPGVSGVIPIEPLTSRYGDYYSAIHAVHFATEQIAALTTFVAYGILERHPRLRVAFLECGATWAEPYLHRLDEHLETFGFDRANLSVAPSEYFKRQCYVSVEEVEPGLGRFLERFPNAARLYGVSR
jgi:predicted TIM-barrel fold metal-dependent hydrolase